MYIDHTSFSLSNPSVHCRILSATASKCNMQLKVEELSGKHPILILHLQPFDSGLALISQWSILSIFWPSKAT